MELTDIPGEAYDGDESPPDIDELESPKTLLKEGPIRERVLDVIIGLRSPTKVSDIADLADCDTETTRDYLKWFDEMGMVQRHDGRPVRYERNDAYFQWRRVEHFREEHSDEEIVEARSNAIDYFEDYREEFDADSPDNVSLVEAGEDIATEDALEAISDWKTLERRVSLLDAATRDYPISDNNPCHTDT